MEREAFGSAPGRSSLTFAEVKPTCPAGLAGRLGRFVSYGSHPTTIGGSQRSTLIIARSPLSDTCYPASCRTTTAAPLVVRGKVFVGISGGEMGRRARVEQSESLSGSANARLCLVGGLSQSFNRAQVIHKTCVTGTLVFLILQAQQRRRVNG